jgi:nucleoside-diphosphate-sugar epimerase
LLEKKHHDLTGNPLARDLSHILLHTESLWDEFRGKSIFITGGTGFFGTWLLESFAWVNAKMNLNASALVLTRDFELFKRTAPHLAANPSMRFHVGDVRDFSFPEGKFSHVIHGAATSAVATFHNEDPLVKFDTIVQGTRHTLDFALRCGAKTFLLTSSGAVYGGQPPSLTHVSEDYFGAPDSTNTSAAWGESKRAAEFLCAYYSQKYGFETKIARCFAFVGPFLPLDIHYAIGNFILDGLSGRPIKVKGAGTPYRSYLYSADLAIWLWTILFKGRSQRAYNVGSEASLSIADLAHIVAQCFSSDVSVEMAKPATLASPPERYVPSTKRAQEELGLKQTIDLKEAIRRTVSFYLSSSSRLGNKSASEKPSP